MVEKADNGGPVEMAALGNGVAFSERSRIVAAPGRGLEEWRNGHTSGSRMARQSENTFQGGSVPRSPAE